MTEQPDRADVNIVAITPAIAQQMLANNARNRSLRSERIKSLAAVMARGEWTLNNDAITLAPDGTVLNGQHRLHAVVMSKTTQSFLVLRNCQAEAQSTMDIGTRRSYGDHARIAGAPISNDAAAALRLVFAYKAAANRRGATNADFLVAATSGRVTVLSFAQMDALRTEHPAIDSISHTTHRLCHRDKLPFCSSSLSAGIYLVRLAMQERNKNCEDFEHPFRTGIDLSAGDPRLALRSLTIRDKRGTNSRDLAAREILYYLRAANAWVTGEKVKRLTVLDDAALILPLLRLPAILRAEK